MLKKLARSKLDSWCWWLLTSNDDCESFLVVLNFQVSKYCKAECGYEWINQNNFIPCELKRCKKKLETSATPQRLHFNSKVVVITQSRTKCVIIVKVSWLNEVNDGRLSCVITKSLSCQERHNKHLQFEVPQQHQHNLTVKHLIACLRWHTSHGKGR